MEQDNFPVWFLVTAGQPFAVINVTQDEGRTKRRGETDAAAA